MKLGQTPDPFLRPRFFGFLGFTAKVARNFISRLTNKNESAFVCLAELGWFGHPTPVVSSDKTLTKTARPQTPPGHSS
jgi:hypothetical protein